MLNLDGILLERIALHLVSTKVGHNFPNAALTEYLSRNISRLLSNTDDTFIFWYLHKYLSYASVRLGDEKVRQMAKEAYS